MIEKKVFLLGLIIFTSVLSASPSENFNADSAYRYIEYLSVTIGPRPMGSAAESSARQWVLKKFVEFDADTAFIMPFTQARTGRGKINTNSGVVIAEFKGSSDSLIIVGGHIDSDGPEIPGANDNASGTATVMELARLWSQRQRNYTMIFCAFGGEELGLIGSQYFVDHFERIAYVKLMISADMGGTPGEIITMFETDSSQAPRWLVEEVFAIDRRGGFKRLVYPTHYSTLNTLSGSGAGSDYMPFLNKGIPAIDFTTGINDSPIHTPEDKLAFISKPALASYGQFIDEVLMKFQSEGIPKEASSRFMLWSIPGLNIFIPIWLIQIFNFLTLILGIGTFIYARSNRLQIPKNERIRFSGLKLFFMLVILAIFAQAGEAFIQLIKGLRYAWLTHYYAYLWYSLLWSIAGLWLVIQLSRRWKFSPDAYVYSKRSLAILFIFLILAILFNGRLGLYPALMLFFVCLAVLIKQPALKAIFAIIAPLPMLRLLFHEVSPFIAKMSTYSGYDIDSLSKMMIYSLFLLILLVIWFLPLLYSYGYVVVSNRTIKKGLKMLRSGLAGLVILALMIGFSIYLISLPAYDPMWRPALRVKATYHLPSSQAELEIKGNEYFKDLSIQGDTTLELHNTRVHSIELPLLFQADWIKINGMERLSPGQKDTVLCDWSIFSTPTFLKATLEIKVDTTEIVNPVSNYAFWHDKDKLTFSWYGDFTDTLEVQTNFVIEPGARIFRKLTAEYAQIPLNLKVSSEFANVRYRTKVEYTDTLNFNRSEISSLKMN